MCRTEQHGRISLRRPKPSKEEVDNFMKKKVSQTEKVQLLGSWLKQWNFLEKGVMISYFRKKQSDTAMLDSDLVH